MATGALAVVCLVESEEKDPTGTSDMEMTGKDTGNPDTFLCVEMKRSGEWTHSTVF